MTILDTIGTYSFLTAFVAFLALGMLLIFGWKNQSLHKYLFAATVGSLLWTGISASSAGLMNVSSDWLIITELLRNSCWCLFLLQALQLQFEVKNQKTFKQHSVIYMVMASATILAFLWPNLQSAFGQNKTYHSNLALFAWVTWSILGLLLVEQLFRNTQATQRWSIKHLCLGIGGLFAYDFYLYSDALLFQQINPALWNARGVINAFAAPLIAISAARHKDWEVDIHVSRSVVFHTATLIGSGVYLTVMAAAGYAIKIYGGTWGGLLQIGFLFGAAVLLLILLFSGTIRAKIRFFLSKHFFSYRYDYRQEWMQFTQTLAKGGNSVPEASIKAIAQLVDSPGGLLWLSDKHHLYDLAAQWNAPHPNNQPKSTFDDLSVYLASKQWIIDIQEYEDDPDRYEGLTLEPFFFELKNAWLIIPVIFQEKLIGILIINQSQSHNRINWEDRDLLKMSSAQVAVHLSQYLTNKALVEARQFDAFNRLSAYIVHDLKNILGQQSLLVANAEKHKHKPAFIDDVIYTLENSVRRMTDLMKQLQTGEIQNQAQNTKLHACITNAITIQNHLLPAPQLNTIEDALTADVDPQKLTRVIGHLIQNAQEATPDDGAITIHLASINQQAIIEITDTGRGMTSEFIQTRLFKPFESTKGLTGMGIGVFESREYIRSVGGDIKVESQPDEGTCFKVLIPLS